MSFDDIILLKSMIAEIYKDNLVQSLIHETYKKTQARRDVDVTADHQINFLGRNLKNIVVLVCYPDVVYLPDEQLDFLSKILLACKLDIGDIAIINTSKMPANKENINKLNTKLLLIFGACLSDIIDDGVSDFFIPVIKGEVSIMTSPSLEKFSMETDESKQLKSKLWNSLKQFFKL